MLGLTLLAAVLVTFVLGFVVPVVMVHRFLRRSFCIAAAELGPGLRGVGRVRLREADELLDICFIDP